MNKFERINYPLKQLVNGDYLWLNIFRITSNVPGPHVHIQANVHGAELQGNAVIFELMKWFEKNPFKGTISFIPFANPMAVNNKNGMNTQGRFNPVSGDNWNRNYVDLIAKHESSSTFDLSSFVTEHLKSSVDKISSSFKEKLFSLCHDYEESVSQRWMMDENGQFNLLLQKIASPADIVLDLHTGPMATRYLYSPINQEESAKHFKFPHLLLIPESFNGAMDEACFVPWFKLTEEFKKQGREVDLNFEAYTVELGSEERISFDEALIDAAKILNYLKYKGVHDNECEDIPDEDKKSCLLKDYKTYFAPRGGLYEYLVAPGESFESGQVLAKSLNFKVVKDSESLHKAVEEVKAISSGVVVNHSVSSAVAQGQILFQVMENYKIYES